VVSAARSCLSDLAEYTSVHLSERGTASKLFPNAGRSFDCVCEYEDVSEHAASSEDDLDASPAAEDPSSLDASVAAAVSLGAAVFCLKRAHPPARPIGSALLAALLLLALFFAFKGAALRSSASSLRPNIRRL